MTCLATTYWKGPRCMGVSSASGQLRLTVLSRPAEGQRLDVHARGNDGMTSSALSFSSPHPDAAAAGNITDRGQQWHPQLIICQLRRPPSGPGRPPSASASACVLPLSFYLFTMHTSLSSCQRPTSSPQMYRRVAAMAQSNRATSRHSSSEQCSTAPVAAATMAMQVVPEVVLFSRACWNRSRCAAQGF